MELRSFSLGLPVDGLRIGSLGASSFGTKQWWKDFTDYWFEGVQNFDSFIGMVFSYIHSSILFSILSLVSFFSRCSAAFARGGMLEFIDSELGACAYL